LDPLSDVLEAALRQRLGDGPVGEVLEAEPEPEASDRAARRFLARLGVELEDEPHDRGVKLARLFAATVCKAKPRCDECPLFDRCRYAQHHPRIKQLPESERPRERLIRDGAESLANAELLALIIRDGTPQETAIQLAQRLLARHKDFRTLSTLTTAELCREKGIGPAKAAQIQAALAIGKRLATEDSAEPGQAFHSSDAIFRYYLPQLRDEKRETFYLVLLDAKNRILKHVRISEGSLSASIVHPREVFHPAIREAASAVLFVHNHPSGNPEPSADDVEITRRLVETGTIVGIRVLDHVIIGDGRYVSFVDRGLLSGTS